MILIIFIQMFYMHLMKPEMYVLEHILGTQPNKNSSFIHDPVISRTVNGDGVEWSTTIVILRLLLNSDFFLFHFFFYSFRLEWT